MLIEPFGIAASDLIHPEVQRVEEHTVRWALMMGLVTDARGCERLRRSRVAHAAARIAWLAPVEQVTLFSQWVTWILVFDDLQDEAGLETDSVHHVYERLLGLLEGRGEGAGALPVERALEDLWSRTAGPMSLAWRERFIHHMRCQREAFIEQTALRRSGRVPTLSEYPQLRRHTNAIFAFDLSEPVHSQEIARPLLPAWTALCEPVNDVMAWCNDLASVARETALGETTNYVTVFQHALGCDLATAVSHVQTAIQQRMRDLAAADWVLRKELHRLKLDDQAPQVLRLARVLRQVPGGHLGWLLESARYRAGGEAPAAPA